MSPSSDEFIGIEGTILTDLKTGIEYKVTYDARLRFSKKDSSWFSAQLEKLDVVLHRLDKNE